jgi:uncharacterized membrane protein YcaP (DUF421 family)
MPAAGVFAAQNFRNARRMYGRVSFKRTLALGSACLPQYHPGMNHLVDSAGIFLGLGADPKDLTFVQISIRGIIVFMFTLLMIRLSARRSLAKRTVFDSIFLVILASVLARAINGSADLLPTLGGGFVLVALHRLLASLAFYSHAFGNMIKGPEQLLIRDGQMVDRTLRWNHISRHDLEEDLRLALHTDDLGTVRVARLERSGAISFIVAKD